MKNRIQSLIERYQIAAKGTLNLSNSKTQNKYADDIDVLYRELRATVEGRTELVGLMSNENVSVRLWAAGHCLAWDPPKAITTLEEIRDSNGPCSFTADITLGEFKRGKLTMAMWRPS